MVQRLEFRKCARRYDDHTGTPECVPMTNDHGGAYHGATLRVLRPECVPWCNVWSSGSVRVDTMTTKQSYVSESVPSLCKRHVQRLESVPMTKHTVSFYVFTSYMMTGGAECVPWCKNDPRRKRASVWSSGSVRVDTMTTPGTRAVSITCKADPHTPRLAP